MRKQERHSRKIPCSCCSDLIWSSSHKKPFICARCKRETGLSASGRDGSGYTSLSVAPYQVLSFGTCQGCHRRDQELANGRCSECRFYSMSDVDPELSARGRRSQGGEFDWVRKQR